MSRESLYLEETKHAKGKAKGVLTLVSQLHGSEQRTQAIEHLTQAIALLTELVNAHRAAVVAEVRQ